MSKSQKRLALQTGICVESVLEVEREGDRVKLKEGERDVRKEKERGKVRERE